MRQSRGLLPPTPYRYVEGRIDIATGMYEWGNRLYAASIGRWKMQDSYMPGPGDLNNANLYLYLASDPVSSIDPRGHVDFSMPALLIGTGITAVLGAIGA